MSKLKNNTAELQALLIAVDELPSAGTGEHDIYEGDYIVTPKVAQQTLPTAQKLMEADVLVKAIPFFNTSNTSGGSTVYIGNEV